MHQLQPRLISVLLMLHCMVPRGSAAQTLALVGGFVTSIAVPSPTAAQYDAVSPANVTVKNTAPDFKLTSTCLGLGLSGCRIFVLRGSAGQAVILGVQYQVVTAVGCTGLVANTAIWTDVPVGLTQIASTAKSGICAAEFAFRIKNLSYSVQQAPATYLQGVTFNISRP